MFLAIRNQKVYLIRPDTEKQAEFIQAYNDLKEKIAPDESIYFIDAVHPTQVTKITSGWIRTGTDKPIKTTGSRTRVNIVGAIQLGRLAEAVTSQYDTGNALSVIDFLESLRWKSTNTGTIHLILDGAGYHRAQILKDKAQELDIKLYYLPPYGYKHIDDTEAQIMEALEVKILNQLNFSDPYH